MDIATLVAPLLSPAQQPASSILSFDGEMFLHCRLEPQQFPREGEIEVSRANFDKSLAFFFLSSWLSLLLVGYVCLKQLHLHGQINQSPTICWQDVSRANLLSPISALCPLFSRTSWPHTDGTRCYLVSIPLFSFLFLRFLPMLIFLTKLSRKHSKWHSYDSLLLQC